MAEHLNETDENRPIKVAEIRQWIMDTDDLHAPIGTHFITFSSAKSKPSNFLSISYR